MTLNDQLADASRMSNSHAGTSRNDSTATCAGTTRDQAITPYAGATPGGDIAMPDGMTSYDGLALDRRVAAPTPSEVTATATDSSDISIVESRRSTYGSIYDALSTPGTSISSAGGITPPKYTEQDRAAVVEPEAIKALDYTSDLSTASRSSSLSPVPSELLTPEPADRVFLVDRPQAVSLSMGNTSEPDPVLPYTHLSHDEEPVPGTVVTAEDFDGRPKRALKPVDYRYPNASTSSDVKKAPKGASKSSVPQKRKFVTPVLQDDQPVAENIDVSSPPPSKQRKSRTSTSGFSSLPLTQTEDPRPAATLRIRPRASRASAAVTSPVLENGADASASPTHALPHAYPLPYPVPLLQPIPFEKVPGPGTAPEQHTTETPVTANPDLPAAEIDPLDEHQASVDFRLHLSKQLARRIPLNDKPLPRGLPLVWAADREALCETLSYYRAYKGACYSNSGTAFSIMLDGEAHVRDHIGYGLEAITARAGGGMEKGSSGRMIQTKDQNDESNQARAMLNNMVNQTPLVVILGNKNSACPSKMPHRYCVLGWYKVTDIISSKGRNEKSIVQYRFERLNSNEGAWAAPADTGSAGGSIDLGELGPPFARTCQSCLVEHQQVFHDWVCLSAKCPGYWKLADGSDLRVSDEAPFDPRWFMKKTPWATKVEDPPYPVNGNPSSSPGDLIESHPHNYDKGMVCPLCGKCISRLRFEGWKCRESGHDCDFEHLPSPVSLSQNLRLRSHPVGQGSPISYDVTVGDVTLRHSFEYSHRINVIQLPGLEDNYIVHMIANQRVLEEPRGPDEMFMAMLNDNMGLERRALRGGTANGHMSAFSVNHGYPYKFVASVASRPFEDGSWVIRETRTQLNFFAGLALKEAFPERAFNELLTFAYLEGEKIKYHDDGESGLGPTVATFSLGAPAEMRFRLKKKYFTGLVKKTVDGEEIDDHDDENDETLEDITDQIDTKKGKATKRSKLCFLDEEPIVGSHMYKERKTAFDSLAGLSPAERDRRCRDLPDELKLKDRNGPACIKLRLAHGDKIIMHGVALQKYIEHEVEPEKSFGIRFANTCREVLPNHLKPNEQPRYEVHPDDGEYDGRNIS